MGLGIDIGSAWDSFTGGLGDLVAPISSAASTAGLSSYAPWIGAGATLLGSMLNNNTSRSLASQQQAFSAQQASTIYQRGAADLAAAGVNPILAYGSPASMGSYTQPNIQPSLALAAQAFNSALDTHSSSSLKYSQQGLTTAQTANEPTRGGLLHAQTEGTNAQTVKTKLESIHEIEKTQKTKFEQDLIKGSITLQSIEGELKRAQTYLASESAKTQMSVRTLNNARSDLVDVERMLKDPELRSKLEHPDLHQASETSQAAGKIAEPFLNLVKTVGSVVKPGTVVNKTYNIRK